MASVHLLDQNGDFHTDLTGSFESLELTDRWGSAGDYLVVCELTAESINAVNLPDSIIKIEDQGAYIAGRIDEYAIDVDENERTGQVERRVELAGLGDMGLLNIEPLPDPSTVNHQMVITHDVHSGRPAELVESIVDAQAGPSAAAERYEFDVEPSGITTGTSSSRSLRYSPSVLEWVTDITRAAGLDVRSHRSGVRPRLTVREPVAHDHIIAVIGNGPHRIVGQRPIFTDAVVGGEGEGATRTIVTRSYPAPPRWPGRRSVFLDRNNAGSVAELEEASDAVHAEQPGGTGLSGAVDLVDGRWFIDVKTGDLVPVRSDYLNDDAVRVVELKLTIDPEGVRTVTPVLGALSSVQDNRLGLALSTLAARFGHDGGK